MGTAPTPLQIAPGDAIVALVVEHSEKVGRLGGMRLHRNASRTTSLRNRDRSCARVVRRPSEGGRIETLALRDRTARGETLTMAASIEPTYRRSTGLVDVLDRVLDKGLVIAGDIRVSLAEVELLTIRIRLLVCSIDKAEEIGLDWWRDDPNLSRAARKLVEENENLRLQLHQMETRLGEIERSLPRDSTNESAASPPASPAREPTRHTRR